MRYTASHKSRTRRQILEAASGRVRKTGIDRLGVAEVMGAVGLTHGGFYKHFADREELLGEAVQMALEQVAERMADLTAGLSRAAALELVIGEYLSERHIEHPEVGCAFAALGSELVRLEPRAGRAVRAGLDAYAARLSGLMPGDDDEARRSAFAVLFSAMAGCVTAARAEPDASRRSALLSGARELFTRAYCGAAPTNTEDAA